MIEKLYISQSIISVGNLNKYYRRGKPHLCIERNFVAEQICSNLYFLSLQKQEQKEIIQE